jgi:1-acyl-sn-glycerol-3-phosphate acyltransferase
VSEQNDKSGSAGLNASAANRQTGASTTAKDTAQNTPPANSLATVGENKPNKGTSNKVKFGIGLGLALGAAAIGSFFLFKMMNRVKLTGAENIPLEHENVLYCLNHNSILDNFAFETAAYLPKVFFRPEYLPVNLADRKNFFGDPSSRRLKDRVLTILGKYFFRHLRAYPVDRRTGDLGQVDQWIEMLRHNIVVVFPEGTRSRTGEIGPGKPGVGKLIYQARPMVIPVRMTGMEEVLGVGRILPRVFHTVEIIIGKPMELEQFFVQPLPVDDRERLEFYRSIANEVITGIKALKPAVAATSETAKETAKESE